MSESHYAWLIITGPLIHGILPIIAVALFWKDEFIMVAEQAIFQNNMVMGQHDFRSDFS